MTRIMEWVVPAVLVACPLGVHAQSPLSNSPSLPGFGPMVSVLSGSELTSLPNQGTIIPGITSLSPTLGTGGSTLPTVGSPAIGTPTMPTIGTPTTPTIGTLTAPTIGTSLSPTIRTPTTPTIGTPTAPTIGLPIGIPTVGSTFGSMPGSALMNSGTPAAGAGVGSTTGSGGGAALTGSGIGTGPDLSCLPEEFICGGVLVRP